MTQINDTNKIREYRYSSSQPLPHVRPYSGNNGLILTRIEHDPRPMTGPVLEVYYVLPDGSVHCRLPPSSYNRSLCFRTEQELSEVGFTLAKEH